VARSSLALLLPAFWVSHNRSLRNVIIFSFSIARSVRRSWPPLTSGLVHINWVVLFHHPLLFGNRRRWVGRAARPSNIAARCLLSLCFTERNATVIAMEASSMKRSGAEDRRRLRGEGHICVLRGGLCTRHCSPHDAKDYDVATARHLKPCRIFSHPRTRRAHFGVSSCWRTVFNSKWRPFVR